MKARFWIAAAMIASPLAAPAAAADLATLGCVREQMPEPMRARMTESARRIAEGAAGAAPADALAALGAAADQCKAHHGWSDGARNAAERHAAATLGMDAFTPLAERLGVKVSILTEALNALSAEQRLDLFKEDSPMMDTYLDDLAARGLVLDNEEKGLLVGGLIVFVINVQNSRADFEKA